MAERKVSSEEPTTDYLEAIRALVQKRPYDSLYEIPAPPDIAEEAKCAELLRQVRWAGGVVCPFCERKDGVESIGADGALQRYRCSTCGVEFNDRSRTLFALRGNGEVEWPLTHWFYGIWLMAHGVRKRELAALWGTHYGTAEYLRRQVERSDVAAKILERLKQLPPPTPPAPKKHARRPRRERPARVARGERPARPARRREGQTKEGTASSEES